VTARLAHIFRHPIKSHGREELAAVTLTPGQAMPWDRHWAVTHDGSKWDQMAPGWMTCANFILGSSVASLMAINARLEDATATVILTHPACDPLTFAPDDPADAATFLAWVTPLLAGERRAMALVKAPGRAMTDTSYPSLSLCNLASNRQLSADLGADLSPLRWRGNLWVEGWEPWTEQGLVGRRVAIGQVTLQIEEPIKRCKATSANPVTGLRDVDTLQGLRDHTGTQNFGLYAKVLVGGTLCAGDVVEVLA